MERIEFEASCGAGFRQRGDRDVHEASCKACQERQSEPDHQLPTVRILG